MSLPVLEFKMPEWGTSFTCRSQELICMTNTYGSQNSSSRIKAVERVGQSWINRLIDLSRRNNLLYYRELKTGTLDCSQANNQTLLKLLGGEAIPIVQLLPEADETIAAACLQSIQRRAQTNLEEKGLETLFLACGMATWNSADDGRPPLSAVLLVPIALQTKGLLKLQRNGEIQVNLILLHALEALYGIKVAPQDLLHGAETLAEDEVPDLSGIYKQLTDLAGEVQGFTVHPQVVLGNFSFQKMAMVRDLQNYGEQMAAHDIIAAIAGDTEACEQLASTASDFDPWLLDTIDPDDEFLVFDADSSQQTVIQAVLSGQCGVIQGPPGTGKSQTIANLITSLISQGKRVLFVAEKRAALEVVTQRMEQKGLGHLLLDFHNADVSRRQVMQAFAASLEQVRNALPVDSEVLHRKLAGERSRLRDHVERLHKQRSPGNLSVYEIQGQLLEFPSEEKSNARFRGSDLEQMGPENAERVEALLLEAGDSLLSLVLGTSSSPWKDVELTTDEEAQDLSGRAREAAHEIYPKFLESITDVVRETKFEPPVTLADAQGIFSLVRGVQNTLSLYNEGIFKQDLDSRLKSLYPMRQGPLAEGAAWVFNQQFQYAANTLKSLQINKVAIFQNLGFLGEIEAAAEQQREWRSRTSKTTPFKLADFEQADQYLSQLMERLSALEGYLDQEFSKMPLGEFATFLKALAADSKTPFQISRLHAIEDEIENLGAMALWNDIKRLKPAPELWTKRFRYAYLASLLERSQSQDPALVRFERSSHERSIEAFQKLDVDRLALAADRVRRVHAERAIAVMNDRPSQDKVVKREALKKKRHLPLRTLMSMAPDVLTALRPCWMASPLSISQLIDAERRYFDVVIFDEASQVLPEDAIPAILRGTQLVVAGDRHQLPPTTFFASGTEDEQEDEVLLAEGFESLLDLLASFLPSWSLQWHYRSRDEALIAFSNQHIYDEKLITFPSPAGAACLSHVLVKAKAGEENQEQSSAQEVDQVIELVLNHATEQPNRTLGVITMGVTHAARLQVALDRALESRPDLVEFFDEKRTERFFIKNLERVQGDERDAIILSIGYGKDRSGKLPHRFGPLLYQGGERRLNVAITRAREQMTVVSSFSYKDIDPKRAKGKGVKLLRLYLEYAAEQGIGNPNRSGSALKPLERHVYETLKEAGILLEPNWGVSQARIDMVARHPQNSDRFVLAIECDGASYYASPTVRDRDRLRQQQLEALGWRFHRIWSVDWFAQRDAEIERLKDTYQAAVEYADQSATAVRKPTQHFGVQIETSCQREPEPPKDNAQQREERPSVPQKGKIQNYSQSELVALIRWILSDGRLRTDEEILREMLPELGFKRRGSQIDKAISAAIREVRFRPV